MNYDPHDEGSTALGWIVALIIILAVIVASFVWLHRNIPTPVAATDAEYTSFVMKCNMRTGECKVDR